MKTPSVVLAGKIASLREKHGAKAGEVAAGQPLEAVTCWSELTRSVPNAVLRSALFGAIKKRGARKFVKQQEVASLDGIAIKYTGERLDQGDLDVWENILHVTRSNLLGDSCSVSTYSLLKLLEKSDTGGNREVLHGRILRLKGGVIEISNDRFSYAGSFIDEVYKDEVTKHYVLRLNARLIKLFGKDQFTIVDWNIRKSLDGKSLAQWLHGFFSTHAKPYPISIGKLHELCGSEAVRLCDFRPELKRSLEAVAVASQEQGQAFKYTIAGDLVHVERTPSASQRKHLQSKRTEPKRAKTAPGGVPSQNP